MCPLTSASSLSLDPRDSWRGNAKREEVLVKRGERGERFVDKKGGRKVKWEVEEGAGGGGGGGVQGQCRRGFT